MAAPQIPATSVATGDPDGTSSSTGLGNVENTKLSTWPGSVNVTTLGAVTAGSFPAANLTGTTLASNIVTSSLTTIGVVTAGSFPVANLTGITLPAAIVASSLTSVGTLSSLTLGGQILSPAATTITTPNYSFVGDSDTGMYHLSAGGIGLACDGVLLIGITATEIRINQASASGSGAILQATGSSGAQAVFENNGYGVAGSFYAALRAGTPASPLKTTTAQVARFGLRGIDADGNTSTSLGGNIEFTPTGTWSVSDHGTTVALWSTPSGSTTRSAALTIDSIQNTTIANTTKGAFQAAGTATTCTGATIGTGSKANAGFVTSTTTGVSTVVVTFPFTAATGWAISPTNNTTANLTRQTASTTTTATFSGTTVTGDVISYIAMAY